MIKACIVPLIVSTLVVGIAGHGDDMKRVGRMAWKSIVYFLTLTLIALVIGLLVANLINPGIGVQLAANTESVPRAHEMSLKSELNKIFQPSFFQAAVGFNADTGKPSGNGGEILAVVLMVVGFSLALMKTKSESAKKTMLAFNESLSEIMFTLVNLVMLFAPIGIFGAMAATVGHSGLGILAALGKLIIAVWIGLIIFIAVVLLPIVLIAKIPLMKFARSVMGPCLIAFATCSSDAALPKAMENMIEFGVPAHVVSFVIPTGYTFNLDGSTLYLAVASVFSAQASGIDMSLGQQCYLMMILLLNSKGIAAVPRASIIVLAGTIEQFGMNPAVIGMILGVDELLNMGRAAVNVLGNCLASVIVAKWEGVYEDNGLDRLGVPQ